jgi:hypothetical protein
MHDDPRIEAACRFIEATIERHEYRLGLEIGEYLLTHLYRNDVDYVFRRDPTKDRSLRDIAAATPPSLKSLSRWIKAAAVRRRLADMGIDHAHLGILKLAALFTVQDVEALAALVRFSRTMTAPEFAALIRRWTRHLDEGGALEDLCFPPEPEPDPPEPRRTHSSEELTAVRLLELVREWLERHRIAPHLRPHLLKRMLAIRARLSEAP